MARDTSNDRLLLHALADEELDAATALTLERRIEAEPAFAAEYERIVALKTAVARLERPVVSDAFSARIAALTPGQPAATKTIRRKTWPSEDWRAMAASLVVTAALASAVTYGFVAPPLSLSIEDSIVSGHRRSLLAASPIDIASSDRHTVRPWLDAKLGVSPPTPDLSGSGFPLVGGRVDVIADKPVPSLVYRHREHLITVVAVPVAPGSEARQSPASSTAGGYNVIRWSQAGFRYWAVSDLDPAELGRFVEDMRVN